MTLEFIYVCKNGHIVKSNKDIDNIKEYETLPKCTICHTRKLRKAVIS